MVVRGHRGQHLSSHVVRSEHGTGSVPCRAPAKAHPWQTAFRARAFQARILRSDMAVGSRRLRSRARDDSAAETAHALAASTVSRMSLRPHRVSGSEKPQTGGFGALLTLGYVDGDALPFSQPHDAGALQRRGVHEDILAALIRSDKAEALIGVVPLHGA
jgi:hypothetical protein